MSYSIKFRPDGRGWWWQIYDATGRLIREAWGIGRKRYAVADGNRELANLNAKELN